MPDRNVVCKTTVIDRRRVFERVKETERMLDVRPNAQIINRNFAKICSELEQINVGEVAGDCRGDTLLEGWKKINRNFDRIVDMGNPLALDWGPLEYLMVIAKYISVVGREEGVDFLHRRDWTEREWEMLKVASQIARALDPNGKFADNG